MPRITGHRSIHYKKGKRRVAAKQPSPYQCLQRLAGSNLHGVLHRGAVWLACTRQLAYFLERVCLGRKVPRQAAIGVPVFLNALGGGAQHDNAAYGASGTSGVEGRGGGGGGGGDVPVVRLSPEEAFYVVGCLGCLTVHALPETPVTITPRVGEKEAEEEEEEEATVVGGGGDPNISKASNREVSDDVGAGEARPGLRNVDPLSSSSSSLSTHTQLVRLTTDELWRTFVRLGCSGGTSHFVWRCVAHVHFRLAGWLPRSGIQYGSDLVLYRNHPSLVHSDFCVVLQPSEEVTAAATRAVSSEEVTTNTNTSATVAASAGGRGGGGGGRGHSDDGVGIGEEEGFGCGGSSGGGLGRGWDALLSSSSSAGPEEEDMRREEGHGPMAGLPRWTEVQTVSRLCVQVNKGLVVAHLRCPPALVASDPEACMRQMTVHEVQVTRFNPERT